MKKYLMRLFLFIIVFITFPKVVLADNPMYWAVDGTKCTSKSASCSLILSSNEIDGEHYADGTFTNTIEWNDYIDSITEIQIGKKGDLIKLSDDFMLFVGLSRVTSVDLTYLDTSELTKTSYMFNGLSGIKKLDVSMLDTSNVINMEAMFDGNLQSLEELVINGIDTSNVTNMTAMFNNIPKLKKLDISKLNTSKVTNMTAMFNILNSLQELNVSGIDTSNVTTMTNMFSSLHSLKELDVSSFNTSNVVNMAGMFNNLSSIVDLDLANFDTRKVTDMADMFHQNRDLEYINLTSFDTSNVEMMREMFAENFSLSIITVSDKWVINDGVDCTNMFYEDESIIGEYGTKYDYDKVDERYAIIDTDEDIGYLWSKKPTPIYYSVSDDNCTSNDTCTLRISSKKISDNNFISGKTYMQVPWTNICTLSIEVIVGGPNDIVKPMSTKNWFNGLSKVHVLDLSYLDTSNVVDMDGMFSGDENLKIVVVSNLWDTSKVQSSKNMFFSCHNIIGMNGTTFNENKLDKEYARLDGSQKGYFWNKTNQTNQPINEMNVEGLYLQDSTTLKVRYKKKNPYAWTFAFTPMNYSTKLDFKSMKYVTSDGKEVQSYGDWNYIDVYYTIKGTGYNESVELRSGDSESNYSYYDNAAITIIDLDLNSESPIYRVLDYSEGYIRVNKIEYVDANNAKIYTDKSNINVLIAMKGSTDNKYVYKNGSTDSNGVVVVSNPVSGEYRLAKIFDNSAYAWNWEVGTYYDHIDPELNLHNPSISISKVDNNSITITIDKQKAEKYIIYRSTNNKKWSKLTETTSTTYTNTGLTYGTTYYYKVIAYNSYNGNTGYSNTVSKKVVPNKVENLRVTSVGQKNIKVAWDKVPVTGYEVYMNNKKVATIYKNGTLSYNKTKLSTNKSYSFKVRAYKTVKGKKIYGSFSDTISGLTSPSTPKLTSVSLRDYNALNINFKSVGGAVKYEIVRSTSKKGKYTKIGEMTTSGAYVDSNLNTGTTYYYKVRVCNKNNDCSGYSSVVSKKVVPLTPKNVSKTIDYYSVGLKWDVVNGATGYDIQRSTNKKRGYKSVGTTNETEFTNSKLSSNKTYYYKVRAYKLVNGSKVYSSFTGVITAKTKKVSSGQKKALDKAKSYLKVLSFSREGLINQLEYHKFSHSDAVFAVNNCGANWKEQAIKKAKSYIKNLDFSYEGLIDQLEYEGFTHEEAVYGADNCGAIFEEEVVRKAKSYLKSMNFSYEGLIGQLEYEGFTHEEAVHGVNNCGANWNEQAIGKAKSYLKSMNFSYEGLIDQLEYEEFTHEQAVYGVNNCGANWNEQALEKAKSYLKTFSFNRDQLISQLQFENFTDSEINYALNALNM